MGAPAEAMNRGRLAERNPLQLVAADPPRDDERGQAQEVRAIEIDRCRATEARQCGGDCFGDRRAKLDRGKPDARRDNAREQAAVRERRIDAGTEPRRDRQREPDRGR